MVLLDDILSRLKNEYHHFKLLDISCYKVCTVKGVMNGALRGCTEMLLYAFNIKNDANYHDN